MKADGRAGPDGSDSSLSSDALSLEDFVCWLQELLGTTWTPDEAALLDLDSLDLAILLDALEEDFGADVPTSYVTMLRTIGDVYDHYCLRVEQARSEQQRGRRSD